MQEELKRRRVSRKDQQNEKRREREEENNPEFFTYIPYTNWFSDFNFIINTPLSNLKKREVYSKIRKPIKIGHIMHASSKTGKSVVIELVKNYLKVLY